MSNKRTETFSRLFALGKLIRSHVDASGSLPMAQLETLHFITEHQSPTMHAVAEFHRITAPSATAHVQELVRLKYVKRVTDPKDRRQVRLGITPLGMRTYTKAVAERKKVIEAVFAHLSDHDLETFNRILDTIIAK